MLKTFFSLNFDNFELVLSAELRVSNGMKQEHQKLCNLILYSFFKITRLGKGTPLRLGKGTA